MSHHHHTSDGSIIYAIFNFLAFVVSYTTGFFNSIVLWVNKTLPDVPETDMLPDLHEVISAVILGAVTTSVAFIVQKILSFLLNYAKSLIKKIKGPAIILIGFCLFSCKGTQPHTTTNDTIIYKDSIVYVDRPIFIEGETVTDTIEVKADCDSVGVAHIRPFKEKKRIGRAEVTTSIDKQGNLVSTASCDSLTKVIQEKDHYISELHKKSTQQIKTKIVYKIPWYFWGIVILMSLSIIGLIFRR